MAETAPVTALFLVPTLKAGGAERLVTILLQGLDRDRVRPVLVLLHSPDGAFRDEVPDDVLVLNLGKRSSLSFPLLVWRLRALFNEMRPEVAVGVMTFSNLLLLTARRVARYMPAVIATEHSHPGQSGRSRRRWLRRASARLLYGDAARVVGVANEVRNQLIATLRLMDEQVVAIPNPYSPQIESLLRLDTAPHRWFAEEAPIVVTVGRLSEEKGHGYMLEALAMLRRSRDVRLLVVGDGPLRGSLERLAQQLGVGAATAFVGFKANPFAFMAKADVFVLPSLREGFGLALLEAMRCSAPVVAADCDYGPREIIVDGESGLLVPPANPEALAAAVARVLDDPALAARLRSGARDRAEAFAPSEVTNRYAALIQLAAAERAAHIR